MTDRRTDIDGSRVAFATENDGLFLPVAEVVDLVVGVVEAEPVVGSAAAEPPAVETFWLLCLREFFEMLSP